MSASCYPNGGRAWHCPTADELAPQALALLPRGRAWATSDGVMDPTSTIARFWHGVSDVFAFAYRRLCDLRLEFWCATHVETHAEWLAEYGLPDACDPFPDLCTKVAAIGGTRCEYYVAVAARLGWAIDCLMASAQCGTSVGSRSSKAGRARPGTRVNLSEILLVVHLSDSPAYSRGRSGRPIAGRLKAGRPLGCGPDIGPLVCVLERIVHANVKIQYEVRQ